MSDIFLPVVATAFLANTTITSQNHLKTGIDISISPEAWLETYNIKWASKLGALRLMKLTGKVRYVKMIFFWQFLIWTLSLQLGIRNVSIKPILPVGKNSFLFKEDICYAIPIEFQNLTVGGSTDANKKIIMNGWYQCVIHSNIIHGVRTIKRCCERER